MLSPCPLIPSNLCHFLLFYHHTLDSLLYHHVSTSFFPLFFLILPLTLYPCPIARQLIPCCCRAAILRVGEVSNACQDVLGKNILPFLRDVSTPFTCLGRRFLGALLLTSQVKTEGQAPNKQAHTRTAADTDSKEYERVQGRAHCLCCVRHTV